jgi:hypothetical protein
MNNIWLKEYLTITAHLTLPLPPSRRQATANVAL